MLTIRDKQKKAFQPVSEAIFLNKLQELLLQHFSEVIIYLPNTEMKISDIPKKSLRELIKKGVKKARHYNLKMESSIGNFVVLMFVIAPNFDEYPTIQNLLINKMSDLDNQSISSNDNRITIINNRITEKEWFEARRAYNKNYWVCRIQETTL